MRTLRSTTASCVFPDFDRGHGSARTCDLSIGSRQCATWAIMVTDLTVAVIMFLDPYSLSVFLTETFLH